MYRKSIGTTVFYSHFRFLMYNDVCNQIYNNIYWYLHYDYRSEWNYSNN